MAVLPQVDFITILSKYTCKAQSYYALSCVLVWVVWERLSLMALQLYLSLLELN